MNVTCKICNQRRAKRQCPGVDGEICSLCCAEGREITIECPRSCEHLRQARVHESHAPVDLATLPNKDIEVTEDFVRRQDFLVLLLGNALTRAMEKSKAVDEDTREALEALIQTYRTAQSGLIYEPRSPNSYVTELQEALKTSLAELAQRAEADTGSNPVRDDDIIGTLIFLQRLALQWNNGRRRGRAFFDFLMNHFPAAPLEVAP